MQAAQALANAGGSSAADWQTLGMIREANGLDWRRAPRARTGQRVPARSALPRAWYAWAIARAGAGQIEEAPAAIDRTIRLDGVTAPAQWVANLAARRKER